MQSKHKAEKEHPGNEAWRVRLTAGSVRFIILFSSGMLMTSAVPPLNWSAAAWVAIIPLFRICSEQSWKQAAFSGFAWGLGWAFTGFYWLYEIDLAIPYLIAPILALFPAVWACMVPGLRRGILIPGDVQLQGHAAVGKFISESASRTFFYAAVLAAWWCITEWFRSRLLPWNFVSASQWRNLPLIQICSITGTYGVSFLIVLTNITLAIAFRDRFKAPAEKKKVPQAYPFYFTLMLIFLVAISGTYRYHRKKPPAAGISFRAGLIQGNVSQRRRASLEQAVEALDTYINMSYEVSLKKPPPDVIIWPETATPFDYFNKSRLGQKYRADLEALIKHAKVPVLIGTIDFETLPAKSKLTPGMTNSAFLIGTDGRLKDKYSKIQRVPFGEYVPFRKYLPAWLIKRIDMHRDLVSGKSYAPLEILPGVRAGMSICYEDIFEYITRNEALEDANLLLVITNDAWYPKSSEPDQHLANCVFRTIETGLPMLRCGNISASCLIEPDGYISDCIFRKRVPGSNRTVPAPEIRGRRAGVIEVKVPHKPKLTFYARYGNVFLGVCWFMFLTGAVMSVLQWRRRKRMLMAKWKKTKA